MVSKTPLRMCAALVAIGLPFAVQAEIVSVNLLGNLPAPSGAEVTGSYGVVSEGSVVGNWNNILANAADGSTVIDVLDSNAAITTVDVVATDVVSNSSFSSVYNGTVLKAGLADGAGGLSTDVTINGINGFLGEYDLIVYLIGQPTGARGSITDGTTTYFYQTPNPADATLVEVIDTNSGDGFDVGTYVVFRGLTADSITLTNDANSSFGGSNGATGIGGFQIVPVPEPATMGLLSIGVLMMLPRRH